MTFHLEHNVANFLLIPHNLCSFCKNALFALLYVYVSVYIRITRREFALFSHISVKVKTASCTISGFLSQLYKLGAIFHVWTRTVIWIVGLWGIEDKHASSAKLWIKLGKTTKKDFLVKSLNWVMDRTRPLLLLFSSVCLSWRSHHLLYIYEDLWQDNLHPKTYCSLAQKPTVKFL